MISWLTNLNSVSENTDQLWRQKKDNFVWYINVTWLPTILSLQKSHTLFTCTHIHTTEDFEIPPLSHYKCKVVPPVGTIGVRQPPLLACTRAKISQDISISYLPLLVYQFFLPQQEPFISSRPPDILRKLGPGQRAQNASSGGDQSEIVKISRLASHLRRSARRGPQILKGFWSFKCLLPTWGTKVPHPKTLRYEHGATNDPVTNMGRHTTF